MTYLIKRGWATAWPAWLWPAVIALSALGAGLLALGEVASPLRPALALWFLFFCPGMALVRLLRLRDVTAELTLAVALSLALDGLVAGVMLYGGFWAPNWGLAALIGISLAGAALQLAQARRRPAPDQEAT